MFRNVYPRGKYLSKIRPFMIRILSYSNMKMSEVKVLEKIGWAPYSPDVLMY